MSIKSTTVHLAVQHQQIPFGCVLELALQSESFLQIWKCTNNTWQIRTAFLKKWQTWYLSLDLIWFWQLNELASTCYFQIWFWHFTTFLLLEWLGWILVDLMFCYKPSLAVTGRVSCKVLDLCTLSSLGETCHVSQKKPMDLKELGKPWH